MNLLNNEEITRIRDFSKQHKLMRLGSLIKYDNDKLKTSRIKLYNEEIIRNGKLTACKYEYISFCEIESYISVSNDVFSYREGELLIRKENREYSKSNDIICLIDFGNFTLDFSAAINLLSLFSEYSDAYVVEYDFGGKSCDKKFSEYPTVKELNEYMDKNKMSDVRLILHKIRIGING